MRKSMGGDFLQERGGGGGGGSLNLILSLCERGGGEINFSLMNESGVRLSFEA